MGGTIGWVLCHSAITGCKYVYSVGQNWHLVCIGVKYVRAAKVQARDIMNIVFYCLGSS